MLLYIVNVCASRTLFQTLSEEDTDFTYSCIHTSSKQPISLVAVGVFQGCKHSDVTGLQLVGDIRGEATQDNVVFETKLLGFEGLVGPKAITNRASS